LRISGSIDISRDSVHNLKYLLPGLLGTSGSKDLGLRLRELRRGWVSSVSSYCALFLKPWLCRVFRRRGKACYYWRRLPAMFRQNESLHLASIQRTDWFAFRVRSRHEKVVALQLTEKEEENFLPLVRENRRWGKRLAQVDLPLFPGYIFCRARRSALLPILRTPGVIGVVSAGSNPVPVDEHEIRSLQVAIESKAHIQPWDFLAAGQRVCIHEGPLAGLHGIVVDARNPRRLVLSLTLLCRSVLVELDADILSRPRQGASVREFGQVA
jgi:transcription antitermination factor NusG